MQQGAEHLTACVRLEGDLTPADSDAALEVDYREARIRYRVPPRD